MNGEIINELAESSIGRECIRAGEAMLKDVLGIALQSSKGGVKLGYGTGFRSPDSGLSRLIERWYTKREIRLAGHDDLLQLGRLTIFEHQDRTMEAAQPFNITDKVKSVLDVAVILRTKWRQDHRILPSNMEKPGVNH